MSKDERIEQLSQQVASLTEMVESLNETIAAQASLNKQLNQTIQELKEQLNKNSQNSSNPPSSDGYKKPTPKSLRKSSGKKVGGQTGHEGTCLSVTATPDEIHAHMPLACKGCQHYELCKGTACIAEKRQVIDAVVTVHVTEHQALELPICMLHGDNRRGEFPEDVKAAVQYGKNLQALSIAFNTVGAVSIKRTHEILFGVFNIPLATGTITSMVQRFATGLNATVATIKEKMESSALGHFDETGTRVENKLWWVHDASNCEYTYLDVSQKRGTEGMEQCGVLPNFKGIAVHDCWASYWNYEDIQHSVCCAHLLRELTGISENHPEQKWSLKFIELLIEMKKAKEKAIEDGKSTLTNDQIQQFDTSYDTLIKQARTENPIQECPEKKRGRKKKGKILALVERLAKYKASVCLFLEDFKVPFDNNQAERDLRMIKVKTKVSGCFRTEDGARAYLKIMSYVGTARKQGYSAYEAIKNALLGNPEFIFA